MAQKPIILFVEQHIQENIRQGTRLKFIIIVGSQVGKTLTIKGF